jgi:xylose isomerase
MAAAKVGELRTTTLADGEGYEQLLADRTAWEDFDAGSHYGAKGYGFVRLQQLATEHLLGSR